MMAHRPRNITAEARPEALGGLDPQAGAHDDDGGLNVEFGPDGFLQGPGEAWGKNSRQ